MTEMYFFFSTLNFPQFPPFNTACHSGSFEYYCAFIKKWVERQFLQFSESWDICLRIFLAWSFLLLSQTWRWAAGPFPAAPLCVSLIYLILFLKDIFLPEDLPHSCTSEAVTGEDLYRILLLGVTSSDSIFWLKIWNLLGFKQFSNESGWCIW